MYRVFPAATALFFLFLCMVLPADATTYRYLDGNGTTCYADDISAVPPQFRSHVVIVVGKHDKGKKQGSLTSVPAQTGSEKKSEKKSESSLYLILNVLLLACMLMAGFYAADRVQKTGRINFAFRIRAVSVVLILGLAIVLNLDLTKNVIGAVHAKYAEVTTGLKAQEERDKKPLKTLSDKVDELMQQVQQ